MADRYPKRLLMLCYHYFPAVSGGVGRSVRFARYLPEYGWTPVVVTTNRWGDGGGGVGEIMRVGELFRRTNAGEPAGTGAAEAAHTGADVRAGGLSVTNARGGLRRAFLRFAEKWLLVPDKHVRWTAMALLPALRLLRRVRAQAIYTTSPPASAHVLGLVLKRLTGVPLIIDLRDPWTLEPLGWFLRSGGARLALEKRIERLCLRNADAIIATTQEAARKYSELYPGCAARIHWIPNGFDAQELEGARSSVSRSEHVEGLGEDVFVIGHLGTFCRYTDAPAYPKGLLDAVKMLSSEGSLSPRNCRIIFAGSMNAETRARIAAYDLGRLISMPGPVSHIEALRIMLRSDLLFLYDPNREGNYYIHGKLYEYLAAGRSILAVLPPGAARNLLAHSGQGVTLAGDEGAEIGRVLVRALRERGRRAAPANSGIARYEGRYQTLSLAHIIDEACR
jgi:glycosyltransferase involved in cell wall biosynthesis